MAVAPVTPPRRPVRGGGTRLVPERPALAPPARRRRSGTQASAPGRPGLCELRSGRQRDAGFPAPLTAGPKKGEAVTWRRLPPRRWPRALLSAECLVLPLGRTPSGIQGNRRQRIAAGSTLAALPGRD
ncbi:hypothetical protein MC885_003396 [Smutsia gigantea]|nr:hypothetical protein MC885_003396 [Smutsia gigantea]